MIEDSPKDKFWGDAGGKGIGKNMLGKILMRVRNELREKEWFWLIVNFV